MEIENATEKTMSFNKINLISIPFMVLIMGCVMGLFLQNVDSPKEEIDKLNLFLVIIVFIVLIVIHELIHGLFFGLYASGGFKTVRFGVNWKAMAPYCHCKEPLFVEKYRIVILMPTVFWGFIPIIVGFIIGEINTVAIGAFMTIGGIGDFLALWMLKDLKKKTIVHPLC